MSRGGVENFHAASDKPMRRGFGMARKRLTRAQSQEQTRERLLDAAAEVFSQRGFQAASVEEVAETAGYSKGAVYSNFTSKEELFLALLDRHLERVLQVVAGLAVSGPEGATVGHGNDAPGASFARHLEETRTWNVLTMEFWLYAMRDERARQTLAERYRAGRAELATRLREMYAAQGSIPPMPVEYLAWALIALGTGLAVETYLDPPALPDELYQTVMRRLLGGSAPLTDLGVSEG
jgi:AcrR family transcriptional regulator